MIRKVKEFQFKIRERLGLSKPREIRTIAVCAAHVPFVTGGAESLTNALVRELKERGYEVDLINIPFKWYPHQQLMKSVRLWQLLDLNESDGKRIDLVISTKFPSYFVQHPYHALWLVHQFRQAYDLFHTPHSGFDQSKKEDMEFRTKLIEMDNQVLGGFRRIHTISRNTSKRLMEFNRIESTPLYHPPKLADRFFCSKYEDFVLSVGRLDSLKRVDLLIKALRHCNERITCKIAGTGPEMDRLRSLARKCQVSRRVEFLGFLSEERLLELYASCSAVYFAPVDEDYGYITLEGFLSRKPVITAFDSGGALEFVKDGRNGIILQSLDEREVGREIEDIVLDKERCRSFGLNGCRLAKTITWDGVIESLVQ